MGTGSRRTAVCSAQEFGPKQCPITRGKTKEKQLYRDVDNANRILRRGGTGQPPKNAKTLPTRDRVLRLATVRETM